MSKNYKIQHHILAIGTLAVICYASVYLIHLVSGSLADWFIRNEMVGWTMYEGYADILFFTFLIASSIYTYYKPVKRILPTAILLYGVYAVLYVITGVYENYLRFYVYTDINGKYSLEALAKSINNHLYDLFCPGFYTFLVHHFCQFVTILWIIFIVTKFKNKKLWQ